MNEAGRSARVPNLGHFFFFLALTLFALLLSLSVVVSFAVAHGSEVTQALSDQRLLTIASMTTYLLALGMAFFAMPVFWHRPFAEGVEWNCVNVRWWLVVVGLGLGFAAQGLTVFFPVPKDLPIDKIFRNPAAIWFLAFFGVVIAPLFEEIVFRGFLLPAIAIAVDWMRIPRGSVPVVALENLEAWRAGTESSREALVVASVLTSVVFAMIHGPQLEWTLSAVCLLFAVSMVLCAVRLRMRSVAASTVVHGCYNLSVFVSLFVATGGFRHLDKV
jgi:membrane protease YdiL (CAAX protease family)